MKGSSLRVGRWLIPTCFWQYSHPEQRAWCIFSNTWLHIIFLPRFTGWLAHRPGGVLRDLPMPGVSARAHPQGLVIPPSWPREGEEVSVIISGSSSCSRQQKLSLTLTHADDEILVSHVIKSAHIECFTMPSVMFFKGMLSWCWGIGCTVNNDDNMSADHWAGGRSAGADTPS